MAKAEERASALARILRQEGREQDMFRATEDAKFAEVLYRMAATTVCFSGCLETSGWHSPQPCDHSKQSPQEMWMSPGALSVCVAYDLLAMFLFI
jgi:hypothetical protein